MKKRNRTLGQVLEAKHTERILQCPWRVVRASDGAVLATSPTQGAELGETHKSIAARLGVSGATISLLLRGATWSSDSAQNGPRRTCRHLDLETARQVVASHRDGASIERIAALHGVTTKTIKRIVVGKTWVAAGGRQT